MAAAPPQPALGGGAATAALLLSCTLATAAHALVIHPFFLLSSRQVTHSNLDLIKALKEEVAELRAAEAARDKLVADTLRENAALAQPLAQVGRARSVQPALLLWQGANERAAGCVATNTRSARRLNFPPQAQAEAAALRAAAQGAEQEHAALAAAKARAAAAERAQRGLEWELEVARQRLEGVSGRRGRLGAWWAPEGGCRALSAARAPKACCCCAPMPPPAPPCHHHHHRPALQVQAERDGMQARLEAVVLAVQQRAAVQAAALERRLEAAASALALARQASPPAADSGAAGQQRARGRASSAAPAGTAAAAGQSSAAASRRGSRVPGPGDWVAAMLQAALHTPLPDGEADILEDDSAQQILAQIAELEAAAGEAAAALPAMAAATHSSRPASGGASELSGAADGGKARLPAEPGPLAALEAKLAAALGAEGAAGEALCIPARRGSQPA